MTQFILHPHFYSCGSFALFFISQIEGATSGLSIFAAGSLLYVAMSDLIPEVHNDQKARFQPLVFLMILVGLGLLYSLTFLEI